MSLLHIHLFQRFDVSCETTEIDGLTAQKACELICFLLTFRHRAHHRELLASQLWEHGSSANAKKNLRQVLWQINSKLTPIEQTHGFEFLVTDQEWIQVNPSANLWLDVAEFEQAYQSVKSVRGQELTPIEAELLACAVRLYRGHLLEGWYQDWCLAERERLHNIYLILLDKLLELLRRTAGLRGRHPIRRAGPAQRPGPRAHPPASDAPALRGRAPLCRLAAV